jgi:hypothetical protein
MSVEVPESTPASLSLTALLLMLRDRFRRNEPIRLGNVLLGDTAEFGGLAGGDKLMAILGMNPAIVGELGAVEPKSSEDVRWC